MWASLLVGVGVWRYLENSTSKYHTFFLWYGTKEYTMKKIFAFIILIVAIVTLIKGLPECHGDYEVIGFIIGVFIVCGIPIYFLFRNASTNIQVSSIEENIPTNGEINTFMYEELKEKCNPQNFMEPYDYKKVNKANMIYAKILRCHRDDKDEIKEIRREAIQELEIVFSTAYLYNKLLEQCNPKNFMYPYNSDKVQIANELYSDILQYANDIEHLENIENKFNSLFKEDIVKKERILKNGNSLDNTILGMIVVIALIIVLLIVASISNSTVNTTEEVEQDNLIKEFVTSAKEEQLLIAAEAKGFKKGTIQNCINMRWTEFNDRSYYSYVKTLKSGMKLYRVENQNVMMEVYVLNNKIKIQATSISLPTNQIDQTISEMDAWIMSCNPITIEGSLSSQKVYKLKDFEVTLRKQTPVIFMMIAAYN